MEPMFDFSEALARLKNGAKLAREGWNGKGMWIAMTLGSEITNDQARSGVALLLAAEGREKIEINPHIDMKASDGSVVVGWAPSQTDLFAVDWVEVF